MSKVSLGALLSDTEWSWLTASATAADLPDEGKAFRCCVNFLAQTGDGGAVAEALAAAAAAADNPAADTSAHSIALAGSQSEWMLSASAARGFTSPEAFASTVVRACIAVDDPAAVFGVVRCKTATVARGDADVAGLADASTACAGAQEALVKASGASASGSTPSALTFRAAAAMDRDRAMEIINAAYMEEAFIKMPFAEQRISTETFDAAIANESGNTEMILAVDAESGAVVGTALLNPPEGTAAGHGATDDCAHLGFVAVDPAQQRKGIASQIIAEVEARAAARGFLSLEFSYISPMTHLLELYRKLGYELTGVVDTPEGDGWLKEEWRGKVTFPHMAKSLAAAPAEEKL